MTVDELAAFALVNRPHPDSPRRLFVDPGATWAAGDG